MKNYNIVSNKEYEGRNQDDLMATAEKNNFKSLKWGTFLQWRDNNRMIIKGQHGVSVFKGYQNFDDITKEGKLKTESRPVGWARVFNEDQTKKIENK